MPHPHFFDLAPALDVAKVLQLTGGEFVFIASAIHEDDWPAIRIASVSAVETARSSDTAIFIYDKAALPHLAQAQFGVCVINEDLLATLDQEALPEGVMIRVQNAKNAFVAIANALYTEKQISPADPSRHPSAQIDEGAQVHPAAIIGEGVSIGAHTQIGPCAVLGPGVSVGANSTIEANVSLTHAIVGNNVHIFSGAQIGQAGFGFVPGPNGLERLPQLGRVIVHDDVEVGSNTTIDRGMFEDTVIGRGTCIDNLVQIAHNVTIGENCILAGHVGISGSCKIGNNVMMGGKAGLADHLTIGDGVRIAAASGCMRDIPAGETWAGTPARPQRQFMREMMTLAKLAAGKKRKT